MILGQGFSDQISKRKLPPFGSGERWARGIRRVVVEPRILPFFAIFALGWGILLVRLFWVMIVRGGHYRTLAEENRVREQIVWAPRGMIYDRHRKPLVLNRPIYRQIIPDSPDKTGATAYAYLTRKQMLALEARGKGKRIEEFISREYPYGQALAHVVGYVGEADKDEVAEGIIAGSLVGKTGLEQSFDDKLRGKEGKKLIEYDALGKQIKQLGKIAARAGEDLLTSLDASLQVKAAAALAERPGAVVISKPATGAILVLYSSPSFNPNLFVAGENLKLQSLLQAATRPLFNRAISGVYPPGSVFKPLVALAALEEGAINATTIFEDNGLITAGGAVFRNWYYTQYGKTEGAVDVVKGLARSVDTFFYRVGEQLGIDDLAKWGRLFGIGEKSGIALAGEARGRMPDKQWKLAAQGERWYLGDTYHTAIGQGDVLVTPLQVNMFTGALANGGKLCRPQLIKGGSGNNCRDLGIGSKTLALIKAGMRKACAPGGTAFPLFDFKVPKPNPNIDGDNFTEIALACKTGTAEFGSGKKTHAWLTVFAPLERPEIVITVLLEGGGSGAYDAAPIAKELLTAYFTQD